MSESLAVIETEAKGYNVVIVDLADVTGDGTGDAPEVLTAAERWEAFEGLLAAYVLTEHRQAANDTLHTLKAAVRDGRRPTGVDVQAAREALDQARELAEEHYTSLATDVVPWDEGAGRTSLHCVLREQLEHAGYQVTRGARRAFSGS